MDINDFIISKADIINEALTIYLPAKEEKPKALHQAMGYSVLAGGKRLRPVLTLMVANLLFKKKEEEVLPAAIAIELIHNYSLIHDDLPCMDDDDYRRGKLTNHKVFGEGIAVLAGDALLTYAFELITQLEGDFTPKQVIKVTKEVAKGAGHQGMIGGQGADIVAEGETVSEDELEYIHNHKTGALLKTAVRVGAILGGANNEELTALTTYAHNIGLSFQIIDDILDIVGDEEKLGKDVGSDIDRDKATFPAIYGLEESKRMAKDKIQEAKKILSIFGDDAEPLIELADYIVDREY
ncbi:polyprenyl synthetase family protein [Selenihalanaerobacter shriftii]|uniref:Farnesyl diphosphate synthase n=1 Tax=Selenihalanaerobacter shriftii TaxID=142842 RepID=A0A1T4P3I7_9FIRM|nr:farnesyl diphosphate synthase [Selenihalanaerobacter shriftii]SJZ85508.1 farnesyl-diphosphate synthase [Selenihalanaerobacter shriftii]